MTLQYAQPIYLLVFYLPDKMLGCSCMLYLLLSAALRRSCFYIAIIVPKNGLSLARMAFQDFY